MLRILTYHRVLGERDLRGADPSLVSATPDVFERQMRHLASRYQVLSAEAVVQAAERGVALPRRSVLITFDDGYRDFAEYAWPILKRYGLTATVFVPTAFPDRPDRAFWWDRLYAATVGTSERALHVGALLPPNASEWAPRVLPLESESERDSSRRIVQRLVKRLPHAHAMELVEAVCERLGYQGAGESPVLGWEELRALDREGVTIAPHTRTHPALTRVDAETARAEIAGSRDDVQRQIGHVPPLFSYPYGAHDQRAAGVVGDEGFELAVTCVDGHNDLVSDDRLRLKRTNLTRRTSPFIFRLRLLRAVSHVDRWRHRAEAV